MKLQDLIIEFLRENKLILVEGNLDNSPNKLLRFVRGSYKYSLVFRNDDPTIHIFKQKTWNKRPYKPVDVVHGDIKRSYKNFKMDKIIVDLNNKDSLIKLLDFL